MDEPVSVTIFGGVVDPEQLGFPFSRMPASDARDWGAIRAWADEVAAALAAKMEHQKRGHGRRLVSHRQAAKPGSARREHSRRAKRGSVKEGANGGTMGSPVLVPFELVEVP